MEKFSVEFLVGTAIAILLVFLSKRLNRGVTISLLLAMAILFSLGLFRLISAHCEVSVYPDTRFLLNTGKGPNKTSVTITNECKRTVYSVFIKIWTDTEGVELGNIKFEGIDEGKNAPKVKAGAGTIDSDVTMIDCIDKDNNVAILINYYQLSAKERRGLIVYGNAPVPSHALAKFVKYQEEPGMVFEEDGKGNIRWNIPEDCKMKAQRFRFQINKSEKQE